MQDNDPNSHAAPPPTNDNVIRFEKRKAEESSAPVHPPLFNMPETTKILTFSIILIYAAIWLANVFLPGFSEDRIYNSLGFVSARWTGEMPFGITALLSLITVNFLHGSIFHVAVNAATLVAFGAGIERRMGGKNMLILFFLSSVIALFTHMIISPHATMPVIGASGGISGLFGGVLIMLKRDGQMQGNQKLLPMVLMWIAISAIFGVIGAPDGSNIAWVAHIGGFLGGLSISAFMFRKSGRLF